MGQFFTNLWLNNRTLVILIAILIIVIPFLLFYLIRAKKSILKGLIAAALSNMGERFGYYIMNAVLLLFLCSSLVSMIPWRAGMPYSILLSTSQLPGGRLQTRHRTTKAPLSRVL